MTAQKVNNAVTQIFIFVGILFMLVLTSANVETFLTPKKVLGIETNINQETVYWNNFLKQNPDYIPGWMEIGRLDKVKEIDPNYFIQAMP